MSRAVRTNQAQALRAVLAERWQALQPRERWWVSAALAVVLGAVLWLWAIQPAWQTRQGYEAARTALERQVQQMQAMRQYAVQLQQQLESSAATTGNVSALSSEVQASAQRLLGVAAQATLVGDRVTVRFQEVPATALAQWLGEMRENTRSQPAQVQVTRGSAAAADGIPTWSGQVVLALPVAPQR